jgi:hypothetical protein
MLIRNSCTVGSRLIADKFGQPAWRRHRPNCGNVLYGWPRINGARQSVEEVSFRSQITGADFFDGSSNAFWNATP